MPITNDERRQVLADAKALAGACSLIPAEMSYRDQLNRFKAQTAKASIAHVHGLRRAYAQARYQGLTGWKAPAAGGPTSRQLSAAQKITDRAVRLAISAALGQPPSRAGREPRNHLESLVR